MGEEHYSYLKRIKWFDICAPIYDITDIFISEVRDKVVEFTNARKNSRILDVATGTGSQAFAFAKRDYYDIVGIDISKNMIKVAIKKNKYENVKFAVADATNMPFDDNYFDVSSVSLALHEMPLTIREKVLKETVRVTKPDGLIVIVDHALPKGRFFGDLVYHLFKLFESRYYSEFVKSDFTALLRGSGIELNEELSIFLGTGRILKGIKINSV